MVFLNYDKEMNRIVMIRGEGVCDLKSPSSASQALVTHQGSCENKDPDAGGEHRTPGVGDTYTTRLRTAF